LPEICKNGRDLSPFVGQQHRRTSPRTIFVNKGLLFSHLRDLGPNKSCDNKDSAGKPRPVFVADLFIAQLSIGTATRDSNGAQFVVFQEHKNGVLSKFGFVNLTIRKNFNSLCCIRQQRVIFVMSKIQGVHFKIK
jgi:hypothetical protein